MPAAAKPKTGVALDPALQQILDAMTTYMANGAYTSMTTTVTQQAAGTNQTVALADGTGATWNYTQFQPGPKVAISPTSAVLGAGQQQQFSATASNPDGSAIASPTFTWSVTGQGTIDPTGLYTAPAAPAPGNDSVKCSLDGTPSYATAIVTMQAAGTTYAAPPTGMTPPPPGPPIPPPMPPPPMH
jgi:hypothetical protein